MSGRFVAFIAGTPSLRIQHDLYDKSDKNEQTHGETLMEISAAVMIRSVSMIE